MIIQKLHLKNFGKFQDKELFLKEGINVIYGENESGKSTIHTFLQSMFFGMKRLRGRASKTDTYTKYSPWKHAGWYEGAITFSCGEKQFRLERSFQKASEEAILFCESDGELLSVKDGDLDMLLGNISEVIYGNTISIGQAKSNTEEGLYRELRDYLSEFQGSGDMRFNPEEAQELLKQKRKNLEKQETELIRRREQEENKIQYEICYEQETIREIQEKLRSIPVVEEKKETPEKEEIIWENPGASIAQRWCRFFAGGICLLMILLLVIQKLPWYFLLFPVAFFISEELFFYRAAENQRPKEENRVEEQEELRRRIKSEERRNAFQENLQEHQLRLENLQEEYDEMRENKEEIFSVRKDLQNVTEAMRRLKDAAARMQNQTGGILQKKVSEILSNLTEGKYRQVILDDDFTIHLDTGEKCLDLYQVSYGTMEQVYLALRLACGEILCQEEEMPLVLDETFAMYDDKRLSNTLNWIQSRYSQVILFSCNKREIRALQKLGVRYHVISL